MMVGSEDIFKRDRIIILLVGTGEERAMAMRHRLEAIAAPEVHLQLVASLEEAMSLLRQRGPYKEEPKPDIILFVEPAKAQGSPLSLLLNFLDQLNTNYALLGLPTVAMVSAQRELAERIALIEAGAVVYEADSFTAVELWGRIKTIAIRSRHQRSLQPLTQLPGNTAIVDRLQSLIDDKQPFAVCYVDINDFKSYNDRYGFYAGDRVLVRLAKIIAEVGEELSPENAFVGHIGGDDFVLIISPALAEAACREIIGRFDAVVPELYGEEDRQRGYIITQNRQGQEQRFPFLGVTIGVAHDRQGSVRHPAEVSQIAAEIRQYLKAGYGSRYLIDRRQVPPAP